MSQRHLYGPLDVSHVAHAVAVNTEVGVALAGQTASAAPAAYAPQTSTGVGVAPEQRTASAAPAAHARRINTGLRVVLAQPTAFAPHARAVLRASTGVQDALAQPTAFAPHARAALRASTGVQDALAQRIAYAARALAALLGCMPTAHNRICKECKTCPNGKYEITPCTNTTDRECKTLGICLFCPPGYFCENNGIEKCPNGTSSVVGTLVRDGCYCVKGWGGFTTNECAMCPPGKYKTYDGFGSCVPCDAGKYSPTWAAVSGDTCLSCPDNTSSAVSSGSLYDCVCNQGYRTDVRTAEILSCSLCQPGTYANLFNMTVCTDCPIQTYSTLVGSKDPLNCLDCPPYSLNYKSASTECYCNAGYSGSSFTSCGACAVGTFKNDSGMQPCVSCGYDTYNPDTAATACLSCRPDSQSPIGTVFSWQCQCNLGYELLYTDCSECEPGSYKPSVSNNTCTSCPADTYLPLPGSYLAVDCVGCPGHASAPTRSDSVMDCACNLGYLTVTSSYPFACIGCIAGTYGNISNATFCWDCTIGKFSTLTTQIYESTCVACPQHTSTYTAGSDQLTDCVCNVGYYGVDGAACAACPRATYKPTRGDVPCSYCEEGKYSNLTAQVYESTCQWCPVHSWSYFPDLYTIADCLCDKGFSGSSGACSSCVAGKYKDHIGDYPCVNCPNNTYSTVVAAISNQTCIACTPFSSSPQGSDERLDCRCNKGYEYLTGVCEACRTGKYKDVVFNSLCVNCPDNTYNSLLAAVDFSQCIRCTPNSTSPNGSSFNTDCVCDPGFYGPSGGPCQACHDGFISGKNASACVPCPAGTRGDSAHLTCIPCTAGYYSNTTGMSACLGCVAGSYSDRTNQTTCQLCARGKMSTVAVSPTEANCHECEAGLFQALPGKTACDSCYAGSFSLQGAWECTHCTPGSISPVASPVCYTCLNQTYDNGNQTECLPCALGSYSRQGWTSCLYCDAGYFLDQDDFNCKGCTAGKYVDPSLIFCEGCPENSDSLDLAPNMLGCHCNLGYERTEDTAAETMFCTACIPGWTHDDFTEVCRICSSGSYSPVAAETTCTLCEPGLYQDSPGMYYCHSCPFNTYMPYYGTVNLTQCLDCPLNSYAPEASVYMDECQCLTGYSYESYACDFNFACHTCDSCPFGYFKPSMGNYACSACDYGTFTDELASGQCYECQPGEYNDELAQSTCTVCAIGTYSNEIRRVPPCDKCPDNSTTYTEASLYIGDCECLPGYSGTAELDTCRYCIPGYWKDDLRDGPCEPCPFDTFTTRYGLIYRDNCTACPQHSISDEASDDIYDCKCVRGYERVYEENCSDCSVGKYKDTIANTLCLNCIKDTFQNATAQDFCYSCDVVSLSASSLQEASNSSDDCVCDVDFEFISRAGDQTKVCRLCVGLSHKQFPGDIPCTKCPKSLSIAQTFYVDNYTCPYVCDAEYDDDGEQCVPHWWGIKNNPWYARLLNVVPHNFNSTIEAVVLVRYNPMEAVPAVQTEVAKVFPALLLSPHVINCTTGCVPLLEGLLKPSSMSSSFQLNASNVQEAYIQNRMDLAEEGYRFMSVVELNRTEGNGGIERVVSLVVDRSYVAYNCRSQSQDSVQCLFYVVVMFVRLGPVPEFTFYNLPVTYVEKHSTRIELVEHWNQETISFAGLSTLRFPGNVYAIKMTVQHGLRTSVNSMVVYTSRNGSRINLDFPVCHYLGARPSCDTPIHGTVLDATSDCGEIFDVEDAWIVLQLTRERFDTLHLSVLLEDAAKYKTFVAFASVNSESFAEMCKSVIIEVDPTELDVMVYTPRENVTFNLSAPMYLRGDRINKEFNVYSKQDGLLFVHLSRSGVPYIHYIIIFTIGEYMASLMRYYALTDQVLDTSYTDYLTVQQIVFTHCTVQSQCIIQTGYLNPHSVHAVRPGPTCKDSTRLFLMDVSLLHPAQAEAQAGAYCERFDSGSSFLLDTSYNWPADFEGSLRDNGPATALVFWGVDRFN